MATETALIGRTLAGRFRVTRFLGEGAMARVYVGTQDAEPRDIAIKVMHPDLASDPLFMRRFRREAKAAACLRHPNVVRIVDHGVDGDLAFIVMELLGGTDLFDLLVAEGRLDQQRACRILIEVCKALSAAHASGIIHRDLKPENVMLVPNADGGPPIVKVLDFGIAKVLERDRAEDQPSVTSSALTNAGAALGTPEYMSPEQCEGAEVDPRSDIYTCGAMLYRIITDRVPFAGAIPLDTMLRHLRDPPTPPSAFVEGLHPGLEAVILKALSKRGADRQASADQLSAELSAVLHDLGSGAAAAPASDPTGRDARPSGQTRGGAPPVSEPTASTPIYRRRIGVTKTPRTSEPVTSPLARRPLSSAPTRVPRPASPPRPGPTRASAPAIAAAEPPDDAETLQMEPLSDGMAETLVFAGSAPLQQAGPSVLDTLVMPMAKPVAQTLASPTALRKAEEPARPPATSSPALADAPVAAVVPVVPLFLITFSVVFVIGMVLLLTVAH